MTFADCRLQTADRRPQTADRRPQTADRRPQTADRRPQTADRIDKENSINSDVIINNIPAQNNINLVAMILLDFSWWFTVMALDSM